MQQTLNDTVGQLNFKADLPDKLLVVQQNFVAPRVADVALAVREALASSGLFILVKPGDTVAVGVGSRGIANIAAIARATVDNLKAHGASPFIVAVMGSHGGATSAGPPPALPSLPATRTP